MSYSPLPGSLAGCLCAYFKRHPEEELHTSDVALKFDVIASSVANCLSDAFKAQLIGRRKHGNAYIWHAGPALAAWQPRPQPAGSNGAAPPADGHALSAAWMQRRPRASHATVLPPADQLRIEKGVPLTKPRPGRNTSKYTELFGTMQPGDSFVCDTPAAKQLCLNAQRWGKPINRKFSIRRIDAQTSRVWRTE